MSSKTKSRNLTRWVARHQGKHLCACGCGEAIEIKREHHKKSVGIPKFIKGHNIRLEEGVEAQPVEKASLWDKLSPEERERRLSLLKNFGSGEDNPAWKGGRRVDDNGYLQIRMPDHPFARDGYIYEHRYLVEERTKKDEPDSPLLITIGGSKYLSPVAVVHHMDENKLNNEISNLMLLPSQTAHAFIHKSSLPLEERIRRISLGIYHSRPLNEEEDSDE